jgi:hypothetical protein
MNRLHTNVGAKTYSQLLEAVLEDRFVALHLLQPALDDDGGKFAIGDDVRSQRLWAREYGLSEKASLEEIMLAQIEESSSEVFYNMDPLGFASDFVRKLPGCVKRKIAWRAAPSPGMDLSAYDLVVCNFESILQSYRDRGWRAALFYPAFDPEMPNYRQDDRTVDVTFVGSYSRHHRKRAKIIEDLASLQCRYNIRIHIHQSRLTRLAETPFGLIPPLRKHRLPKAIGYVARPPVFGRALYSTFGNARIVLNGSIDMAGVDRGNMRCWEALGCGALMLSDQGVYPPGFIDGETMVTYEGHTDMVSKIDSLLANDDLRRKIALSGSHMIASMYSKQKQWSDFQNFL